MALLLLLLGLLLLLYPSVSDLLNSRRQSQVLREYEQDLEALEEGKREEMLQKVRAYHRALLGLPDRWQMEEDLHRDYLAALDPCGTGVMCRLEIPAIGLALPVYHGTEPDVLQIALGHLEGSTLPVGGKGTHCVITGHCGLPSARLFTDLHRLKEGDRFTLWTLGRPLRYELSRISVVEPEDRSALAIEVEEDLCTLMTCTPYGVNSHRLLLTGKRIAETLDHFLEK